MAARGVTLRYRHTCWAAGCQLRCCRCRGWTLLAQRRCSCSRVPAPCSCTHITIVGCSTQRAASQRISQAGHRLSARRRRAARVVALDGRPLLPRPLRRGERRRATSGPAAGAVRRGPAGRPRGCHLTATGTTVATVTTLPTCRASGRCRRLCAATAACGAGCIRYARTAAAAASRGARWLDARCPAAARAARVADHAAAAAVADQHAARRASSPAV